jgi:hypothetical protein
MLAKVTQLFQQGPKLQSVQHWDFSILMSTHRTAKITKKKGLRKIFSLDFTHIRLKLYMQGVHNFCIS